ncbi:hypothetical protein DSM104299_04883 [Baekduia alba]|uniref:hypothetical protein n=1 Tax=Baekduia alba TaxID=2997333 RepID=UPI0023408639|nr:hypothetical protein [Baekduia alba]WCB96128.1 hypothetical protein DSM104299_04883 [Baekduia alba]
MPNVLCNGCGLTSYAPTPHNAPSLCPYCDAELFPSIRSAGPTAEDDGERDAEAA